MPQLLGIHIEGYRSLVDVRLGRLGSTASDGDDLSSVSCFIGRNGSGKSTLMDVVAFLADCLREGVEAACDKEHRGGFERLRTQGRKGPIRLTLYFRLADNDRPIRYALAIDQAKGATGGVPHVAVETLEQSTASATRGKLKTFLDVRNGKGRVWAGHDLDGSERFETVDLPSRDKLAIATYGQLPNHPRIAGFLSYLESWYLSYFVPGDARRLSAVGAQRRLDRTGSNLGNFLQYMERQHGDKLKEILREIASTIPGLATIKTKVSEDKRLLIAFGEDGYTDPFFQYAMSDGTLKMFAYLLLLHDPDPPAFIGIEEPENGLYHQLHGLLASQMLELAERARGKTQLLVTTHSPYFVDAIQPEGVWSLVKEGGATRAVRASSVGGIKTMIDGGLPLGSLWYSNHLNFEGQGEGSHPG